MLYGNYISIKLEKTKKGNRNLEQGGQIEYTFKNYRFQFKYINNYMTHKWTKCFNFKKNLIRLKKITTQCDYKRHLKHRYRKFEKKKERRPYIY